MKTPSPLIVIVGSTASGKSALAMKLALQFEAEIICADARTIYKGMDIGTAKPTKEDQAAVPHHLIDAVTPDQQYNAADFKTQAKAAIQQVVDNENLPLLVGGTGLYVDALLYDYAFRPPADPATRARLSAMTVEQLQDELKTLSIPLPSNARNPRHLTRAIETGGELPKRKPLRKDTLILGLEPHPGLLKVRVTKRTAAMMEEGLRGEVTALADKYGWDAPGLSAIGYREFASGDADDVVSAAIIRDTLQYAKRQRTWFKRNKSIHWVNSQDEAVDLVTTFLSKYKI
jgi:tRNA dimethylallyltransferase